MISTNNKILGVIAFLVLALIIAFYATKDLRRNSTVKIDTDIKKETGSGQENKVDRGYKIEVAPVGSNVDIPVPDLNRSVNFETADSNSKLKIEEISKKLMTEKNNLSLWVDLGSWRRTIKDYEGARLAWEYVVTVSPNYIVPLINLGDLYQFDLKDNQKAEEYMKKVITKNPSSADGYYRLSSLYTLSYKEKIAEAPKILLQGLTANPKSIDLMIMLAEYYRDLGDKTSALDYYKQALSLAEQMKNDALVSGLKSEISALSQ